MLSDIRALVRLQADHINRNIIPSFYKYLQSQDADAKIENGKKFLKNIERLCETFEKDEGVDTRAVGLWREGGELGWADVMAAPCKSSINAARGIGLMLAACRALPRNKCPSILSWLCSSWRTKV
jgi:hypothetical protein